MFRNSRMRGQEKHWTGILLKNDLGNSCFVKKCNLPIKSFFFEYIKMRNYYFKSISNKKKISSRTIITKESEKIINEELLKIHL